MKIASDWKDYQVIATGDGEKLERWGKYVLLRPDPQVIWHAQKDLKNYNGLDAHYLRSSSGGGGWQYVKKLPEEWTIEWHGLKFIIKPMGFKHTGLFPEQAVNWNDLTNLIKNANRTIKVLNLFAYTGGASVVCSKAGASVTHVDASKGMVERAKENAKLNGITNIRYIIDDCKKFIERESHVVYGVPKCFVEGILVNREYEQNKEKLEIIKKAFPNAYICNLDGKVIIK